MRKRTIIFTLLISCSVFIWAQRADQLLPNITHAINEQHWDEASNLFRIAIEKDPFLSEQYFQKEIALSCPARSEMLRHLGNHYKNNRNFEKSYDFYKEYLQGNSLDIKVLINAAELEVLLGKEKDALKSYEKILLIEANNLQANIYIGNYYYFEAEKERIQLDKEYKALSHPTRMQYAHYRTDLTRLAVSDFGKAKIYLERVIRLFPSVEAKKTLEKIRLIEIASKE